MNVVKTFSLKVEDAVKFEAWMELNKMTNQSQAFRLLLRTAGVIEEA